MKHIFSKIIVFLFTFLWYHFSVFAQNQIPMKELLLNDLSNFKPQAGNWQIVGDVNMDRHLDVHEKNKKPVVTTSKGTGILINLNDEKKKDQLITNFEHGDIDLELEFMIPKGSNSGIYLQGRYEVQLLDSWGIKKPAYSDLGGIYRNWEKEPLKIYMGKAPTTNAAKAPGLWQTMKISFIAPRFDDKGQKISNARFNKVEINGIRVHDNVEVPLPTGGPIENNEKASGPLMIQGDHGSVAFRNIKYRTFSPDLVKLSEISYSYYEGKFNKSADFLSQSAKKSGKTNDLSWEVASNNDQFGISYTGKMTVPSNGTYIFSLLSNGGAKLMINNETVIDHEGSFGRGYSHSGKVDLQAGTYPFTLFYYKNVAWNSPALGLYVESNSLQKQSLHSFNSLPPEQNPASPILVNPSNNPKILRAFYDYRKSRDLRKTHTIAVGDPQMIHYIYDLKSGSILAAWRGDFVDATPMWHERGDGSFLPSGSILELSDNQPLATLANKNDNFPKISKEEELRGKGYEIEENSSRPIFKYIYNGINVEDKIYPEEGGKILTREVKINSSTALNSFYFKIAEGKIISDLSNGEYAIDDKTFYIKILSNQKPLIRDINGTKELVISIESNQPIIKYSIIW